MFDPGELTRAVDLQKRSYALLRFLADAVKRGFVTFDTAHHYATLPAAAQAWIERHHDDLPPAARPPAGHEVPFARMFATFLETSFDLVRDPGQRLYSPDAHCFCPMCSWLVDAPNLRTKKPEAADKARARSAMLAALRSLAIQANAEVDESLLETCREQLALVAYGRDLLTRMAGGNVSPASLVLWRTFAWEKTGSPKKGFELEAETILAAERLILAKQAN